MGKNTDHRPEVAGATRPRPCRPSRRLLGSRLHEIVYRGTVALKGSPRPRAFIFAGGPVLLETWPREDVEETSAPRAGYLAA